jgi:type IV fimbrial biogenesis protein FimT
MDITSSTVAVEHSRGFTLVELVTLLAIVSIIFSIAVPNIRLFVAGNLQRSEINVLITHLNLARSEAVKQATRIVLCPTDDNEICDGSFNWNSGFIVFADENANRHRDIDEALIRVYQNKFESQISINAANSRRRLTYQPDGSTPGSNVTITFCNPDLVIDPKAVIISNTGRVRISERRPDGSPLSCS